MKEAVSRVSENNIFAIHLRLILIQGLIRIINISICNLNITYGFTDDFFELQAQAT